MNICSVSHGSGSIMPLMHLVHRMECAADQCFFAPHGLSLSTGRMLMVLFETGGMTPTELTQLIGGKKSNTTQRIALLKKGQFVEVQNANQTDRRSIKIVLTEKGEKVARDMKDIFGKHIEKLESGMTESQKKQLITIIDLLHKQLDASTCLH